MHLIERTIDRDGLILLMPELEIEGWLTSLELPVADIVALYWVHGTHDLERLPSRKFATNNLVLSLAVLVFNILRSIGQTTLIDPDSQVRHPAKRRGLRTVMREIIGVAARVIKYARRLTLGLDQRCGVFTVFERHYPSLLQFSG